MTESPAAVSDSDPLLRSRLIDEAYQHGRGGLPMTALAVLGIVAVHWFSAGRILMPAWLVGMAVVVVVRALIIGHVLKAGETIPLARRERLFIVPLLVNSLLWALLAPLQFPSAGEVEQLALICIQAAMAGGAATVLAPLLWSARFYIACMLLPASWMVHSVPVTGPVLSVLGVCFTAVMLTSHRQARKLLVSSQQKLLENHSLLGDVHRHQGELSRLNDELLRAQSELWNYNSRLEAQVSDRTERMRLALAAIENTAEGVMVATPDEIIVQVNPAFSRITGYGAEQAVGAYVPSLYSPRNEPGLRPGIRQALAARGRWEGEVWSCRRDGSEYLQRLKIDAVRDAAGRTTHYVAVFNDATEDYKTDQQLRHLALHDPLTGLGNRSLLMQRLEEGIAGARAAGRRLGVLFFDLDQFKSVNDNFGHHTGDALLKAVAGRLVKCLKSSDTLARVGGDEFVVLAGNVSGNEDCARLAMRLLESFVGAFDMTEARIHMRSSLGIALFPDHGQTAEDLLKNADMALYAAKAAGRDTFAFFDIALAVRARERLDMELALRDALAAGEMSLYYQAKVDARSGAVTGYEGLMRWHRRDVGMVPPDRFIPVAEEAGLIGQLGSWALSEACRQIAAWYHRGLGWQRVAINVSARELMTEDLPALVAAETRRHSISPSLLEVEVTETFVMTNPAHAMPILERLRGMGVSVAIDDFGTGHSSLAYLRRLPADVLKIDRSFVSESEDDATVRAIIATIVSLSRTLRLRVVAEGVETEAQARLLRQLGCDVLQGYLFARPLPAAEILPGQLARAPSCADG